MAESKMEVWSDRLKTLKLRLNKEIKPCYWVSGEDYYLYEKAVLMIQKAINLQLEDFNRATFDDDSYQMQQIVSVCEVMPMGSDKRLVLVKNISKITETDKAMLLRYLENPCLTTVLVILDFHGQFGFLKSVAEAVDARRMDKTLAKSILVNELAKYNKQISAEAADMLLEYCNGYLTIAMNEISKLVYYDVQEPLVTKKVVEAVVPQNAEFTVFELTEALGKKNFDKALHLLAEMEKDPGTLGLITNHFRRLFYISISDMDNASLANLLNVKEFAIVKQREQVKNFSKMQLKKIYALLEQVDYQIKSGQMVASNALYYLVFSIAFI